MVGVRMTTKELFSFPNPVNEYAARMVAGMVLTIALAIIIFSAYWLLPILAYGFVARVVSGPTLSPMGLLATRVLVPLFGNHARLVPGPPKRFAQGIGVIFAVSANILHFSFGLTEATHVTLGVLAAFAGLEALLGFCAGCFVFNRLMHWGLVPASVCESCYNLDLSGADSIAR